jgi:membrane-associated PAP2 superfamily phosphatase
MKPAPHTDRTHGLAAALLLLATLGAAQFTELDLWVQELFYDHETHRWWIDSHDPLWRLLLYTGPKAVLILLGIGCLVTLVLAWRGTPATRRLTRTAWRPALHLLACLVTIPLLVSVLKDTTHIHCPSQLDRYGGQTRYVRLFDRNPADPVALARDGRGRCFPAGHASGGFALLGLAAFGRTHRQQWAGFMTGVGAGSIMGYYQMAKGAHFLSHTLTTFCIAWLLSTGFRMLLTATLPAPDTLQDTG